MVESSSVYGEAETDQILVPIATGYKVYPLTQIFGIGKRTLRAWGGMGLSPLHFITQRGPLQDGITPLDMRFDPRTIQIVIAEQLCSRTTFWDRKWDWFDLLRPNRSFNGTVNPLIYRKWLPHGKLQRGTDLETTAGSDEVTSVIGKFVERGLITGMDFYIETGADAGTYLVVSVPNDYTVQLDTNMGATAANVHWRYARGRGVRDLNCLLAQGPEFDQDGGPMPTYLTGYREALRFIAHDPFWYGTEQIQIWDLSTGPLGDLVFDGAGAWLGETLGIGRWLFLEAASIAETVSVIYWGTAAAKPVITITGPGKNPIIENTTIGTRIEMNYTIATGETVTIDTLALTVVNSFGTNLLPFTTGDIATFQLSPAPQAPDRINNIFVSFTNGLVGTSEAQLTWQNRHVGLAGG